MADHTYRAAVIGCGRIGATFGEPAGPTALSHAGAYYRDPRTELCGLVDTDPECLRAAEEKWSAPGFSNLHELMETAAPEIVSICVPTSQHVQCLESLTPFRPAAVVCEKPLALSVAEAERVVSVYEGEGVPLLVNYSRRFDNVVVETRDAIQRGEFGQILNASVRYSKGLLNNGSHALDLLQYLFGSLVMGHVFRKTWDFTEEDPTVSAWLSFERCPNVHLIGGDERHYSVFEVDIVGEHKRRLFERFGLEVTDYSVVDDPVYEGYRELAKSEPRRTGLDSALSTMVNEVTLHLDTGAPIRCSGRDALATLRLCEQVLAMSVDQPR